MKIGLLLYPDCIPSGLLAFSELLIAANMRMGTATFEFSWLSEHGGTASCRNGLELSTEKLGSEPIDGLLVPGAWRDQSSVVQDSDRTLVQAMSNLDRRVFLMSYCTGVHLVAQTGRLDHHPATTTWWLLDSVRHRFPDVQWKMNNTLVRNTQNATASGVNGYLPIALALIARLGGENVAEDIRKYMVLPRPVQHNTPFQQLPQLLQQGPWIRDIFMWVEKTPATQLRTTELARHLNMTPRTLGRQMSAITGYKSAELMRLIKLNQVSDQLIGTNKTIDAISDDLGFSDNTSLRRSFSKLTGFTPGEYRRQFG